MPSASRVPATLAAPCSSPAAKVPITANSASWVIRRRPAREVTVTTATIRAGNGGTGSRSGSPARGRTPLGPRLAQDRPASRRGRRRPRRPPLRPPATPQWSVARRQIRTTASRHRQDPGGQLRGELKSVDHAGRQPLAQGQQVGGESRKLPSAKTASSTTAEVTAPDSRIRTPSIGRRVRRGGRGSATGTSMRLR